MILKIICYKNLVLVTKRLLELDRKLQISIKPKYAVHRFMP